MLAGTRAWLNRQGALRRAIVMAISTATRDHQAPDRSCFGNPAGAPARLNETQPAETH
jgi:hypothetical protein